MINQVESTDPVKELRRTPRLRIPVPFACSFSRLGLARWRFGDRGGHGVVFDLSVRGARVMSPLPVNEGDELAISLRLPNHPTTMSLDATVRWHQDHMFGLEFGMVPQGSETRLRKYLARI
ncbi:MAG TPA: PilZ domain-containing protein [Nitrospira sp.]|nr:PilZ domain-containing protein [Nitrospira sp.]